jgi:hypothetical protein
MDSSWIRVLVARASTGRRWPDAQRWDAHSHFAAAFRLRWYGRVCRANQRLPARHPSSNSPSLSGCLVGHLPGGFLSIGSLLASSGYQQAPAAEFRVVPGSPHCTTARARCRDRTSRRHSGNWSAYGDTRAHAIPCFLKPCICMHAYFDWETKRAIHVEIKYTKQVHNRWGQCQF